MSDDSTITPRTLIREYLDNNEASNSALVPRRRRSIRHSPAKSGSFSMVEEPRPLRRSSVGNRRSSLSEMTQKSVIKRFLETHKSGKPVSRKRKFTSEDREEMGKSPLSPLAKTRRSSRIQPLPIETPNKDFTPRTLIRGLLQQACEETPIQSQRHSDRYSLPPIPPEAEIMVADSPFNVTSNLNPRRHVRRVNVKKHTASEEMPISRQRHSDKRSLPPIPPEADIMAADSPLNVTSELKPRRHVTRAYSTHVTQHAAQFDFSLGSAADDEDDMVIPETQENNSLLSTEKRCSRSSIGSRRGSIVEADFPDMDQTLTEDPINRDAASVMSRRQSLKFSQREGSVARRSSATGYQDKSQLDNDPSSIPYRKSPRNNSSRLAENQEASPHPRSARNSRAYTSPDQEDGSPVDNSPSSRHQSSRLAENQNVSWRSKSARNSKAYTSPDQEDESPIDNNLSPRHHSSRLAENQNVSRRSSSARNSRAYTSPDREDESPIDNNPSPRHHSSRLAENLNVSGRSSSARNSTAYTSPDQEDESPVDNNPSPRHHSSRLAENLNVSRHSSSARNSRAYTSPDQEDESPVNNSPSPRHHSSRLSENLNVSRRSNSAQNSRAYTSPDQEDESPVANNPSPRHHSSRLSENVSRRSSSARNSRAYTSRDQEDESPVDNNPSPRHHSSRHAETRVVTPRSARKSRAYTSPDQGDESERSSLADVSTGRNRKSLSSIYQGERKGNETMTNNENEADLSDGQTPESAINKRSRSFNTSVRIDKNQKRDSVHITNRSDLQERSRTNNPDVDEMENVSDNQNSDYHKSRSNKSMINAGSDNASEDEEDENSHRTYRSNKSRLIDDQDKASDDDKETDGDTDSGLRKVDNYSRNKTRYNDNVEDENIGNEISNNHINRKDMASNESTLKSTSRASKDDMEEKRSQSAYMYFNRKDVSGVTLDQQFDHEPDMVEDRGPSFGQSFRANPSRFFTSRKSDSLPPETELSGSRSGQPDIDGPPVSPSAPPVQPYPSRASPSGQQASPSHLEPDMDDISDIQASPTQRTKYVPVQTPHTLQIRRKGLPVTPLSGNRLSHGRVMTSTPKPTKQKVVKMVRKAPPPKKKKKDNNSLQRMPASLTKGIFSHFLKANVSKDVIDEVEKITDKFWKNVTDDLDAFANHAGHTIITQKDVELLMKRQGFITEKRSMYTLVDQYLPLEYRQEIIPMARSGNKVFPKL